MKQQDIKNPRGLLPLHNDIVFKIFCTQKPHLLARLLDAVLGFQGSRRIQNLKLLNPEIPGEIYSDKLSVLDIRATDQRGEHFGIEMQAYPQNYYGKRALFYWGKIYATQLNKGEDYPQLQKTYSISFLNFKLFHEPDCHSVFQVLKRNRPEIALTPNLEIHIFELAMFTKNMQELKSELDYWIYLLQKAAHLQEEDMRELKTRNPIIKEAIEALQDISLDRKTRDYYELRLKSERDFNAREDYAYDRGIEQGIQKERKRAEKLQQIQKRKDALRTAIKLKESGMGIDFITGIVELPENYISRFFKKIRI